ncbi:MAG: hypothetical protein AB1499_03245 [Nitrospirota bacterium]
MKTLVLRIFVLLWCLLAAAYCYPITSDMEWENAGSGIMDTNLHAFAASPTDPSVAYTASYKAVYRTIDAGNTWDEIFSLRGTDNGINTIAIAPLDPVIIYAGTAKGLYRSSDKGQHWGRIFQGTGEGENMILAVFSDPENPGNIYIGTSAGIFFTEDSGENWYRGQNLPSDSIVTSISNGAHDRRVLYAASVRGIYKSTDGSAWERVYKSDFDDSDLYLFIVDEEESSEDADVAGIRDISHIRKIISSPEDSGVLYAATSRGLLMTTDGGQTWTQSGTTGLVSRNIHDIAVSPSDPDHVYAATDRGIFRYSENTDSWDEMYKGIATSDIRCLAFSPAQQNAPPLLWAVTKTGLYKLSAAVIPAPSTNHAPRNMETEALDLLRLFDHEPSMEEIKEAAIEYAEVSPDKITKWRKAAANRAWLPDLSMKYGSARDWQNSSYFYSTKDEKYKDDDITKGRDSDWYVSLTWNLGDLIWDDAQTSIDNRSKLMVQLRDDLLNEVTRLYFERRRLQIDMVMSPPGSAKEYIDRDLRLQELTASIDALTDSFLSKRLSQIETGAQRRDVKVK